MDKKEQRERITQAIVGELRRQSNVSGDLVAVRQDGTLKVDGEFSLDKLVSAVQKALADG